MFFIIERVEHYNKKKRDEKFHGMRSEQDLKKQLDQIERAARHAMTASNDDQCQVYQNTTIPRQCNTFCRLSQLKLFLSMQDRE